MAVGASYCGSPISGDSERVRMDRLTTCPNSNTLLCLGVHSIILHQAFPCIED